MRIRVAAAAALACAGVLAAAPSAQPVFTGPEIFSVDEFAARRGRVMAAIGDAIAVMQGTTERPGEQPLRQGNQFFYLSGVVEPRAFLLIDGRSKQTFFYVQPGDDRRRRQIDRQYGTGIVPGDEAAKAYGVDAVLPRDEFRTAVEQAGAAGRIIYTTFRPEVLGSASSGDAVALARATKTDPWDGRPSREETFLARLKEIAPRSEVKDLDPILDAQRAIKSAREIEIVKEATRLTGLGIIEAMRIAEPGRFEYELQAPAERVFKQGGAYGASYFALIATGKNTLYSHYHKNTSPLTDGDLVQFDYAPDYKYYSSDVTRVFPANGRFTPRQRELYGVYLKLYQALMTSITVHAAPRDIVKSAVGKMDTVMASFRFTDPKIKEAATRFVEGYRNRTNVSSLGHAVGMEVHDVGRPAPTLEPGMIFTIEPAMTLPDEHIGVRLEDMILITDRGYENLSAFVPIEIDAIEKEMGDARAKRVGARRQPSSHRP